jgi:hypothetical protein
MKKQKKAAKTRYRVEIEIEAEEDVLAQDLASELERIGRRFPGAKLSVSSCHLCPQCETWRKAGKGVPTLVRDHDLWCPTCRSIVAGSGEPQRGLFSACVLPGDA